MLIMNLVNYTRQMKKLIYLFLILFSFPTNLLCQREQDSLALVALYNSTGGAQWKNNNNWLSSLPISKWYGITVTNNRVTAIILSGNYLKGFIPPEIGNLTGLTKLFLDWNNFQQIPQEIGKLTDLIELDLSYCQFTGTTIPREIGNLTKLKYLSLNSTFNLKGTIPSEIGNLIDLTDLYLNNTQLTDSIPVELGNLTNLSTLKIGYTLRGSIPSQIGNLKKLTSLELMGYFKGSLPMEIWDLTNLTYLCIESDGLLTGSIPTEIGNLTKLTDLVLEDNQLSGPIPSEIGNLTNLSQLFLESNQLSGSIPSQIGNLVNLRSLDLSGNQLSGAIPSQIGYLKNLSYLHLSSNNLTGTIPSEIGNLTNLVYFELGSNQLTGSIPSEIGTLTNLVTLNLGSNKFTGSIPLELYNLNHLYNLYLDNNQLDGLIPKEINNLSHLAVLRLNNNRFEDLPRWNSNNLQAISIQNNHFTFEDIEPYMFLYFMFTSHTSSLLSPATPILCRTNVIYFPQDSIGLKQDIIRNINETYSFTIFCGGDHNLYQWYKDEIVIPAATNSTYTIPYIQQSDKGTYFCAVTNTLVTNLTIYSRPTKLAVSLCTDIDEYSISGIKIYPNPSNGIFNIESTDGFSSGSTLDVYDINGRSVLKKKLEHKKINEINLSCQLTGVYFLHINIGNKSYYQKILIK
jgi:Leucine-rich repeat (LRR) protein